MHCKSLSAIYFNLDQSKILSSGYGLNGGDPPEVGKITALQDVSELLHQKLNIYLYMCLWYIRIKGSCVAYWFTAGLIA